MPVPSRSQSLARNQDYPHAPKSRRLCIARKLLLSRIVHVHHMFPAARGVRCISNKKRFAYMFRIILDTDPGIDDALALFFALASPEVQLEAITTVGGNVN